MALPADFDLAAFLKSVDLNSDLRGMRVVYFDGVRMIELREGPPYCQVGLLTIVLQDGIEDAALHSPAAAQSRNGKLMFELLGVGLSCSAAVLGWVVVAGSAGAAPITGGTSVFLTYLAIGAASASSIQCVNAIGRAGAEVYAPHELDVLDSEGWYQKTTLVLDGISLAGAVGSAAITIRMALRLKAATSTTMMQVLKGLTRQQRRALAEEAIKIENPGISGGQLKMLVRAGVSQEIHEFPDQPRDQKPASRCARGGAQLLGECHERTCPARGSVCGWAGSVRRSLSMTDREQEGADEDAAVLLDGVMRGERGLLFPPGTFVASLFIPCFAIGVGSLMMTAGMAASRTRNAILGSIAAAVLLTGMMVTGHILIVRGRPHHRAWMRIYLHVLIAGTVAGGAVAAIVKAPIPWLLVPVALISLASCEALLGSRAYVAFSSFLSLKRQYREDQALASRRVLGRPRSDG